MALAAGSGRTGDDPHLNVGQTSDALVQQLAQLPRSTVVQATRRPGRSATTRPTCAYGSTTTPGGPGLPFAETHRGSHGINDSVGPKDVVMDFWIVDLDGTPVVVEMWLDEDASSELLDMVARTRDSITFVTTG